MDPGQGRLRHFKMGAFVLRFRVWSLDFEALEDPLVHKFLVKLCCDKRLLHPVALSEAHTCWQGLATFREKTSAVFEPPEPSSLSSSKLPQPNAM